MQYKAGHALAAAGNNLCVSRDLVIMSGDVEEDAGKLDYPCCQALLQKQTQLLCAALLLLRQHTAV
jgi:hypothetical protein